jgi:hypothetical protein
MITPLVEQIVKSGKAFQLVFLLVIVAATYASYYLAKKGRSWPIRPLEGLEAVREGIARCAEMGRPVLVTPGISSLTAVQSAQTIAGLTMLGEVAQRSASIGVTCTTNASSEQIVLASEAIVRNALTMAGRPELYSVGKYVRWFGSDQFSYAVGCAGQILEENPGLVVFMGYFLADTVVTGETATRIGAIKIGGTLGSIAFLAMMCDYLLIGEEMFVASAAITEDKNAIATIASQDWIKLIVLAFGILGVVLYALGDKIIYNILGM